MDDLADYEELQYFAEASTTLVNATKNPQATGQSSLPNTDIVTMENTLEEEQPTTEMNRLREENQRLKKTLADKFYSEFDQ